MYTGKAGSDSGVIYCPYIPVQITSTKIYGFNFTVCKIYSISIFERIIIKLKKIFFKQKINKGLLYYPLK